VSFKQVRHSGALQGTQQVINRTHTSGWYLSW